MDYRDVEGVLGGLRERGEARFARSLAAPRQPQALTRRAEHRVDVTHALHRLPATDRQVVMEHYVTGAVRHPARIRRTVVKKLLAALGE